MTVTKGTGKSIQEENIVLWVALAAAMCFSSSRPGYGKIISGAGPGAIYDFAEAPTTYEKHTPSGQEKTVVAAELNEKYARSSDGERKGLECRIR